MENQRLGQSSRRELDAKDEEHERQIGQLQKKVKGLEEQIEHEYEEKSAALKVKIDSAATQRNVTLDWSLPFVTSLSPLTIFGSYVT